MNIDNRLKALRKHMVANQLDAYIIPSTDPHQSEYVAPRWESRRWISGFTGSAGTVVVTIDHAGLWTDSRYYLQAQEELDGSEFVMHKMTQQGMPQHEQWVLDNLEPGQTVGFDKWMFSIGQVEGMRKRFAPKHITLVGDHDLVDLIWEDRPTLPTSMVIDHPVAYAGESRLDKLNRLQQMLKEKAVIKYLVSTLDDIAWLLNIRGSDVPYNPVVISYVLVGLDHAILFIDETKLSEEVKASLTEAQIQILPYEAIGDHLAMDQAPNSILINKASCNYALYSAVDPAVIRQGDNLVMHMKAVKNETEIKHFKEVMKKDAVALCHLFMWLEDQIKDRGVPEAEIAERLAAFRSEQPDYYGESFSAIVGYESNGAIIHYRPEKSTNKSVKNEGILLLDSGGQYIDGTTDITRTVHFSEPTEEQKKAYTNVLKGHIALDKAKFPKGTTGAQLDTLARQFLWNDGMNYLHGTGHGVGFFLNVHEAPQGFAPGSSLRARTPIVAGMITSNEPGYYKAGAFGIRIENLILSIHSEKEGFLEHETITLFPIDTTLINIAMMTDEDIAWLNDYHAHVFKQLSPLLDHRQRMWMEEKCQTLAIA